MKKFTLTFIALMVLLAGSAKAQNLIAVQHVGSATFFAQLDSAVVAAQYGDTIYLPGGIINCGTITIDKRLHIIGAGIRPDSSSATKTTQIFGNNGTVWYINANESSFTGFKLTGIELKISANNNKVSRCDLQSIVLGDCVPSSSNGNVFYENIIGTIFGQQAQGNSFHNNQIGANAWGHVSTLGSNNLFRNNIFLEGGRNWCSRGYFTYFNDIFYSFFENNIFYQIPPGFTFMCLNNCNFRNNIFMDNVDLNTICPDCNFYDNIINQELSTVFIEGTYHLQPTCPGKNAGTDGTDIGIYGGLHPWKDGSLPVNPHVQFKNIYNSTDSTGILKVNIKVSAQDR